MKRSLALAAWLNKIGRPAKTLEVLPQARAITTAGPFPAIPERARRARSAGVKSKIC